ncbi:MAG: hypothetical protein K0S53_3320 [Bacteroidetes bacterium]|nr:hypothetical protein [Bacteroidota bacterium]
MKPSNSFLKNNKTSIILCMILLAIHSSAFSQNKLVVLATSEKFYFVLPVACVLGLAIFLMMAFLKQKNH